MAAIHDLSEQRIARAAEVIRLEAHTIAQLEARLDRHFLAAVDMLLECQGSIVVTGIGKAGLVGQKVSATLASTGTPSLFLHPTEALHGDLGRIRSRDIVLVISNSGETVEVNALIAPARKIGARVVAITGRARSTLARLCDCVLDIGDIEEACPLKLAPTASTSAMMALGDALAMVVSQERNFSREDYALYHPAGSLGRKLMRVREVMRKGEQVPLAGDRASIKEVVIVMNGTPGRPGAALITDDEGKLVGIFTHGDLSRLFERRELWNPDQPVAEYMGKHPKSIGEDKARRGSAALDARVSHRPDRRDRRRAPAGRIARRPRPARRPRLDRSSPVEARSKTEAVLARARLLALDVDGVLTDGRIVYGASGAAGEEQRFDVQDGLALRWLQREGIVVAWITGRGCPATAHRARELEIGELHTAALSKRAVLEEIQARLDIDVSKTIAMGDDLPDLGLRAAAGFFAAPNNARPEIKERADFVTLASGGAGAVRELAELVLRAQGRWQAILDAALR